MICRLIALALATLAPLAFPAAPPAAPRPPTTVYLPFVTAPPVAYSVSLRSLFDGEPDLVVMDGDRAVVRLGVTIGVIEMRDGLPPRLVARSLPLPAGVFSLAAREGLVYAASGSDLITFRVDGATLRELHRVSLDSDLVSLVPGPRHLVGRSPFRLVLIDLAVPEQPSLRGRLYGDDGFVSAAVTDSYVFYAGSAGNKVWAAPLALFPKGAIDITPRSAWYRQSSGLVAWGHNVLVGNGNGLQGLDGFIQDATVPGSDKTVAQIDFGPWTLQPAGVSGTRVDLFLLRQTPPGEVLAQLDVADPRRPLVVAQVPAPWPATGEASADVFRGGRVLRRGNGALWRYHLTGSDALAADGAWRWRAPGELLAVSGRVGYFQGPCRPGEEPLCLRAVDLQEPDRAPPGDGLPLPAGLQSLTVAPPLGYATVPGDAGSDLLVIDLAEPWQPRVLVTCALATGRRLAASATYLAAFDFANPAGMAVAQQRRGIELFQRHGRACPEPLTTITSPHVNGVLLDAGYLVAALHLDGIAVFDLADPGQPQRIALVDPLGPEPSARTDYFDLAQDGSTAIVAAGDRGLLLMDLREPNAPRPLAYHADWCLAERVVARDGLALASCRDGLALVDISTPDRPSTVTRGSLRGTVAAGEGGRFYVADASHDVWEIRATRRPLGEAP
jgi:hypothetical protein